MNVLRRAIDHLSAVGMKVRTALAVSLLFLFFVTGLAWIGLSYFQRHFEETVYKQQMALVNSVAEALDTKLIMARDALAATALQVRGEILRDPQQAQFFLDRQQALLSIFDNGLLLISEEGKVVAESPFVSGGRGRSVTHTDVFKGVSASKQAYISRPFASVRANGRPVLSIGIPVLDDQGRMVARLHGSLELLGKNLLADLINFKVGASGYLYLSTTDRLMIVHPDRERIMRPGPPAGQNLVYDRSLLEPAGSGRTITSRGVPMLVSYQRVRSTNWVLGVNYPEQEAFAPFYRAKTIFISAVIAGSGLVLILVWWMMRRFMAPLEHMTRHVVTLAQRQGEARFLRYTARDEVGTLGQAFDRMLKELDAKEHSLREANAQLEQRVAQRTEALENANIKLQRTVDELNQAREYLVQSEKMAALGNLVAGVAHEINTPLGVSVTAASHLEEQVRELDQKARNETLTRRGLEEFIQRAQESAGLVLANLRRAAELIRSFKQVAVDQTGGQRRTFELAPYLEEVVRSLSPQLRGRPYEISVFCPSGVILYADPGEVSQIITNFVMNALMHAFEGRASGHMRIAVTDHTDEVVLTFSDDGVGMAADVLPRIFDPFYTTKRGQGGSGLGLHLVYNIVTQSMGGRIECHSEPGRGTVFEVFLPRRKVEEK